MSNYSIPQPIQHAARAGMILGLYMAIKYLAFMYTLTYPLLGIVYFVATLALPLIAYLLTKSYRNLFPADRAFPFALAWAHSVQVYVFGAIIALLPQYLFYSDVLHTQLPILEKQMNMLFAQNPNMRELFTQMMGDEPIVAIRSVLTSQSVWLSLWNEFSFTVFWGGIFSLVIATILRRKPTNTI